MVTSIILGAIRLIIAGFHGLRIVAGFLLVIIWLIFVVAVDYRDRE